MFLGSISKRERWIALAAVILAAFALTYDFLIEPLCHRWGQLNAEVEAKQNILRRDSKLLAMRGRIESDYAKLSKYAKTTKKEDEEIAVILAEIEAIARNSSCFLASIKPHAAKAVASYKEVLIDVAADANMNQFSKFLYDIENSPNILVKIKRFTISSKSGQPDTLRGTFLISKILVD